MNKAQRLLETFFNEEKFDFDEYWGKFEDEISSVDSYKNHYSFNVALSYADDYIELCKDGFEKYGKDFEYSDLTIYTYATDENGRVDLENEDEDNVDVFQVSFYIKDNQPQFKYRQKNRNKFEDIRKKDFDRDLKYASISDIILE